DHEIEVFVAERVGILRPVPKEMISDFLFSVCQPMSRDVEAENLGIGQKSLQLVEQMSLATADIKNLSISLQPINIYQRLGGIPPTALDISIAPIAVAPIAIPVIEFILLGLYHADDLVVHHAANVVALGLLVQRRNDI